MHEACAAAVCAAWAAQVPQEELWNAPQLPPGRPHEKKEMAAMRPAGQVRVIGA